MMEPRMFGYAVRFILYMYGYVMIICGLLESSNTQIVYMMDMAKYTPILDLTILDLSFLELTDFIKITKCDNASLKTDLNLFPGVFFWSIGCVKNPWFNETLTESLKQYINFKDVEDGGGPHFKDFVFELTHLALLFFSHK